MYSFASDNTAPVHPQILNSLLRCNEGPAPAYGADDWTLRLDALFSDLFEHDTFVFPTTTGTAANGLALSAISPPHGAIFCHRAAHIVTAECGAPEFFSGGARLILLPGKGSKISAAALRAELAEYTPGHIHALKPAAVSITQATEQGCVYSLPEITALSEIARATGMRMHLDGARFANALVHLNIAPAQMTWKCGIDVVSFGTTKNGTMMSEAVLVFDKVLAEEVRYRRKRAGLLQSKMRYFSAQLIAYLDNDLWLKNARLANANAQRLCAAFTSVAGVAVSDRVEANEIFVHLPLAVQNALSTHGIHLRPWPDAAGDLFRLVTSFADDPVSISTVERVTRQLTQEASP